MAALNFLFGDTFDHYLDADKTDKWTGVNNPSSDFTVAVGAPPARNGPQGLRVTPPTANLFGREGTLNKTLFPGDVTTCVFGVAFRYTGAQTTYPYGFVSMRDVSTVQVMLSINPDGTILATRGNYSGNPYNGNTLGTSSVALLSGVYYHIKCKVVIHPSAGTLTVWVNGISVLALTGINTRASAASQWNVFSLGFQPMQATGFAFAMQAMTLDYDDLYVNDADIAPTHFDLIGLASHAQSGNGAFTDYTPLSGSNHGAMVMETYADGDTSYNASSTIGNIDTYLMDDLPVGATPVFVQSCDWVRKTDAGDRTVANVFRIGGTNYVGADLAPSQTYACLTTPYTYSPASSAAWTRTEFNAMEAGEKVTG